MTAIEFNRLFGTPETQSLIRKAFTSATGVGEAIIPEFLEDVITNTVVRLVPELAIPVMRYGAQKSHEFIRLTSLPLPGSAMGENSTTPTRNSTTERAFKELKVHKRKGAVTGFVQDASTNFIDAQAFEMETHLQAFGNDLRTYILYGNADADSFAFDGLDRFISSYRRNEVAAGVIPTSLSTLDDMIDNNLRNQGSAHRKVFEMSPEMLSLFSRLYTQVRDNREAIRGTNVIQVDGGWRLQSYRDVPIVETTATRPVKQQGTVTIASAGSGGAIPNDQYFFQIAPVTWDGEQRGSAEVNVTTTNADTITLSFTADNEALFYKVYVGTATGANFLRSIVSGFTYDSDGSPTASITQIQFTSNPTVADSSVPTHMQLDRPLGGTADGPSEVIFLWDLDEFQGLGKLAYTNTAGSRFEGLATVEPLAKTDDNTPFLVKSYLALIDSFERTSALHRGLRTR